MVLLNEDSLAISEVVIGGEANKLSPLCHFEELEQMPKFELHYVVQTKLFIMENFSNPSALRHVCHVSLHGSIVPLKINVDL